MEVVNKIFLLDIIQSGIKNADIFTLRELISYYGKDIACYHIDRERFKTNPLRILDSKEEKKKQ